MWDLAGKAKGVPTAQLLGGASTEIPVYASTAGRLAPGARAESALTLREQGFRALKIRIDREAPEAGLAAVTAVREAVGTDMEIMVDLNQGWRMPGDVAPLLGYDAVAALAARLRRAGRPLARGAASRARTSRASRGCGPTPGCASPAGRWHARPGSSPSTSSRGALDVLQPDAVLAVGVFRARELAERVLAAGLWFTPHTWTNGIGLLTNLHLAAGVGGGPFIELPFDPPGWTPERRDFMLAEPVRPSADGPLAVPDRPGLGFELDEEAVERYTVS